MTVSVACLFGGPVITVTFQRSLRAALAGKKSGRIYIRFTQITTFSHALAGLCCSLELCMQRSPDRQNSRRAHALPLAYMYSCTAMVVLAEFQSALRAQLGHRSPLFFLSTVPVGQCITLREWTLGSNIQGNFKNS